MKELIAIQRALHVPKDQEQQHYKYRTLPSILEAFKKIAPDNVYLLLDDEVVFIGNQLYTKATASLYNGDSSVSVSAYAREPDKIGSQSSPQISGSCSTYARKLALVGLLGIDDGSVDPDTLGDTAPEQEKAASQPFNDYKKENVKLMTGKQKGTLKDQIVALDAIGSESANKAITAINELLGYDTVGFDNAEHLINRVKKTIEKA